MIGQEKSTQNIYHDMMSRAYSKVNSPEFIAVFLSGDKTMLDGNLRTFQRLLQDA